jgi:diadenosine tetraphosphatase ApaH/serine/threonine PP2A family protein phosphatase
LVELARIPKDARVTVHCGDFADQLSRAPQADLNIFGMPDEVDFNLLRRMVDETRASCVFSLASGEESALA